MGPTIEAKLAKGTPVAFKAAIGVIALLALVGGVWLFTDSGSESQADAEAKAAALERRRAAKSRHASKRGTTQGPRLGTQSVSEDKIQLENRSAFDPRDPSTWSDVIDATRIPKGFDPNDPSTYSLLEEAYNKRLADIKRRRDAKKARNARNAGGRKTARSNNPKVKHGPSDVDQAKGTLEVLVLDQSDAPISNVSIYPPLARSLELFGGQVRFEPSEESRAIKSDSEGKAKFDAAALGLPTTKSWPATSRIVIQSPSFGTVIRELKTRDLQSKDNTLRVNLQPAVFVEVKVVDRDGNAVPDALVTMKQGEGRYADMKDAFSATAASDGRFQLKVAPAYRYIFNVSAKDYVPYTTRAFDFLRDERLVSVTLQSGRGVEGYVFDSGKAVEGAKVHSETDGVSAMSDSNGYFVLASLKDRVYSNRLRVRVTKKGHAPVVKSILVNEQGLEFDLPKEGMVSGVVMREGVPVGGAEVSAILRQSKKNYNLPSVLSDENGAFTLSGVGAGSLMLTATHNGTFSPPVGIEGKANTQAEGVELKLGAGGSVAGTLKATFAAGGDGPLGGVTILVDGKAATTVASDGSFSLLGLAAGPHSITLAGNMEVPEHLRPFNLLALSGEPTRYFTLPAARKITSKLGEEVKVDLHVAEFLERTHREISLRFQLNSAEDIAGVEVVLTPNVGKAPNGHKTAPVLFQISLVGGVYLKEKVQLLEEVKYSATIQHPRIHRITIAADQIDAVPHEGVLEVPLERARSFRAYVKDSSGNAVANVRARVNGVKGSKGSGQMTTDQHGYFEIGGLEVGTYSVVLFKQSYYEIRQEVELTESDGEIPTLTLLGANEIRVRVISPGGVPQPGARVWAVRPRSDNPNSSMQYFNLGETDGEGRKVVNFHWIRHYQVTATKGNQIAFVNFDNKRDTPIREYDIQLEPYQRITGTVKSRTSGQVVPNVDVYASLEHGSAERMANKFFARAKGNGTFTLYVPIGTHTIVVRESRVYLETATASIASGSTNVEAFVDSKDKVEGNWAEFISVYVPIGLEAGQKFSATITVKNKGSTTWSAANGHRLGTQSPRDTKRWGPNRIEIVGEVRPGDTYTFTAELKAPSKAATYNMQWRMLQSGKEWFGESSRLSKVKVGAVSTPPPAE